MTAAPDGGRSLAGPDRALDPDGRMVLPEDEWDENDDEQNREDSSRTAPRDCALHGRRFRMPHGPTVRLAALEVKEAR